MKYQIGDTVEPKNGYIITITDIQYGISGEHCYITETVPIPEEKIVRRIEKY